VGIDMPGTNNFLQWNPTAANQENDTAYAADSARSGGAGTGSIFQSQTANKLFFQLSTTVVALAGMMAAKNYNMSDANITNLQTALTNILTNADVSATWAATGHFRLAGFEIKWGQTSIFDTGPVTVAFDAPFQNVCYAVMLTQNFNISTVTRQWEVGNLTINNFQARNDGSGQAYFIAIGH